jgi:hypothetical protein
MVHVVLRSANPCFMRVKVNRAPAMQKNRASIISIRRGNHNTYNDKPPVLALRGGGCHFERQLIAIPRCGKQVGERPLRFLIAQARLEELRRAVN